MNFLFVLGFAALGVGVATHSTCSEIDLFACAFLVDGERLQTTGAWPENKVELDKQCDISLKVLKCLKDFSERCPNGFYSNLGEFFKADYDVTERVCNGDLQKSYLKNAKCMNAHNSHLEKKCGPLMDFEEAPVLTEDQCKLHQKSIGCYSAEVKNSCGADTLSLIIELVSPTKALMKKLCKGALPVKQLHFLSEINKRSLLVRMTL